MDYSKTVAQKLIFHFEQPFLESIPEEVADEIESFRLSCKGKIGFSNDNKFDKKRLDVMCEEKPVLTKEV